MRKGQEGGHVSDDDVETGIGPVFALELMRVRCVSVLTVCICVFVYVFNLTNSRMCTRLGKATTIFRASISAIDGQQLKRYFRFRASINSMKETREADTQRKEKH